MSYESINKIKSLQQQIETFTGKSYGDLTAAVQELKNGYGSSGGGSGIIDVTELPTENIDENAVYRVVVKEADKVYIVTSGSYVTVEQFAAANLGTTEVQLHWVNELPDDMMKFNAGDTVLHLYLINSTAVVYLWISGFATPMTVGTIVFSSLTTDKGYTADITLETEDGVYVQKGQSSEDWFYRENGEWVRITPEQENKQFTLTTPLRTTIIPEEGKVFSSVTVNVGFKSIGDFIDNNVTLDKITENDLTKTDGTALTYIRNRGFAYAKVKSITLPSTVTSIGYKSFDYAEVEEVTFKGRPIALEDTLFSTCPNLKTLNVSWGNVEVSGAPWGATNATINYNYTGE